MEAARRFLRNKLQVGSVNTASASFRRECLVNENSRTRFLPFVTDCNRRHEEIVESMTKGEVPVRDMGRVGKELGRLETVLEKQEKVEDKTAEIQDLEEVRRWVGLGLRGRR